MPCLRQYLILVLLPAFAMKANVSRSIIYLKVIFNRRYGEPELFDS